MKITITKEEKELEIDCKNPRGKDTKKGMKLLFKAQKEDDGEGLETIQEYLDFLETITCKYTDLTVDFLDDLEIDEKNKLITFYQEKVQSSFDFLKSSLTPAN